MPAAIGTYSVPAGIGRAFHREDSLAGHAMFCTAPPYT